MGNGGGPYKLFNSDYQTIKSGTCITSGDFSGCIQVGASYYWLSVDSPNWQLNEGDVDGNKIVKFTPSVWDKVKDGGTYTWNGRDEYWTYRGTNYRLGGYSGNDLVLMVY